MNGVVKDIRTGLWHLRRGGLSQLRTWWARRSQVSVVRRPLSQLLGREIVEDIPRNPGRTAPSSVTAACILDDFSALAWSEVFTLIPLTPQNWGEQLNGDIDVLFVESAWSGSGDTWRYQLTGPKAPSDELRALVADCRRRGIPTVFWNKEDPPHFADFIETARLFDVVFTSDVNLVPEYQARLGHDAVLSMPFAAATHMHRPVRLREGHQVRDVAFAGTWFAHKYPERREQMEILLGGAIDASRRMQHGLDIFSRFMGGDDKYQFPGELAERVIGSLSYEEMLIAYKAYKVFLNVNSVIDSPSMCARRVFEILASGTPVVSTPSAAISALFPEGEVAVVHDRQQAELVIRGLVNSPELRGRMVHRAQRRIWREHTYAHRAEQVMASVGQPKALTRLPSVSILASTNRPHQLRHLFSSVGAQREVSPQLVLVAHGFDLPPETAALARDAGVADLVVAQMPSDSSLGRCLNHAVELADGAVLSKMDDDDRYGPYYLLDLIYALRYSRADVVGKQAAYMHLASTGANLLRFGDREHRWTDFVLGPTITAHRQVFEEQRFADRTQGEDTTWLRGVVAAGGSIYAADRFNFVQMRAGSHTWEVTDEALLASGVVAFFGDPVPHVFV